MTADERNKFRRINKEARKYYLAPDVVKLIEQEHGRTGYSRGVIIEMLVRQYLGNGVAPVVKFRRKVAELAGVPAIPEPEAARRRPKADDFNLDI